MEKARRANPPAGGIPIKGEDAMVECDCDVVPLTFMTIGTEKVCPVCQGRVNYLSREEFEDLLRNASLLEASEAV
jgi:hypothetical protein